MKGRYEPHCIYQRISQDSRKSSPCERAGLVIEQDVAGLRALAGRSAAQNTTKSRH